MGNKFIFNIILDLTKEIVLKLIDITIFSSFHACCKRFSNKEWKACYFLYRKLMGFKVF
jgi:hypothetical protein